jgi:hypothetical protein
MPRPRKTDRSDGAFDNISPPAVPENAALPAGPQEVVPVVPETISQQLPVKRPRGRPRKYPLPGTMPGPSTHCPSIPTAVPSAPTNEVSHPPVDEAAPPTNSSAMDKIEAIIRKAEARSGVAPVKRPRGRPRKNPLPGTVPPGEGPKVMPGPGASVPSTASPGTGPSSRYPESSFPDTEQRAQKPEAGPLRPPRRPRAGAQPPEAFPRPRGRRPRDRIPPFTIAPGNQSPFCPKCGTYIRLFKPKRGRWRRVCPRCRPERLIEKRDPRFNLDKTGMPCKDRGKCRPERCVKALECTEMARKGGIRGSSHKNAG